MAFHFFRFKKTWYNYIEEAKTKGKRSDFYHEKTFKLFTDAEHAFNPSLFNSTDRNNFKKVQTAVNKVQYITANEFVTSLLLGAKVKPNAVADCCGKAVQMGLIPGEVKKDKSQF